LPQAKSRPTEKEKDTSIVLTSDDVAALCELHSDLVRICLKAKERNVKVVIDAEYRFVPFSRVPFSFL
jgi:proline dehydrogenase